MSLYDEWQAGMGGKGRREEGGEELYLVSSSGWQWAMGKWWLGSRLGLFHKSGGGVCQGPVPGGGVSEETPLYNSYAEHAQLMERNENTPLSLSAHVLWTFILWELPSSFCEWKLCQAGDFPAYF